MSYHPGPDEFYSCTIGAACQPPLARAVQMAVRTRGGTIADFVRGALVAQLTRDGFTPPPVSRLDRVTFLHTERNRA